MTHIDFNRPVQTMAGDTIRIICTDAPGWLPIVGILGNTVHRWDLEGHCSAWPVCEALRLQNVPIKIKEGFVPVFYNHGVLHCGTIRPTPDYTPKKRSSKHARYLGIFRIEYADPETL